MVTLLIDTSHEKSLVAFAKGVDVLLTIPLPVGLQSSLHLFPAIKTGFKQLELNPGHLSTIVVAIGPGSFTGIRVGVAAAKGLAAFRDVTLLGACSLHGFATDENTASAIDARIGGVYLLLPDSEPKLIFENDLSQALQGYEKIAGPMLDRLGCLQNIKKIEKYPDPSLLLKNAFKHENGDLDLIYLRDTVS